jgi:large subunit ribosomal protein L17
MRHLKAGRKLGRNATHRLALMRNLTRALLQSENGRIITTVEKAKEARRFIERLITLAKKKDLHHIRLVRARLGPVAACQILDEEELPTGVTVLRKLFEDIAPRFQDRPGGYTRIVKRHERRLGDGGKTAILELLKAGETKIQTRKPVAPTAPRVSESPAAPPPAPAKSETPPPPPAS